MKFIPIVLLCIIGLGYYSCKKINQLDYTISKAKLNKSELIKVLKHYESKNDTIGYKSAKFLIENMMGKVSVNNRAILNDIEIISGDFLIQNIDLSIEMCSQDLLSGKLPLNVFFEYVLPYKIGKEPLTEWRKSGIENYKHLVNLSKTNIEIVTLINKEIIESFKYNPNAPNAEFRTWEDLTLNMEGDCWAMSKSICYPLRSLGIPTAIDFIPAWGNTNGVLHAWNSIVLSENKSIPFLGGEESPPDYNPFRIYKNLMRYPPKVFRKTYSPPSLQNTYYYSQNMLKSDGYLDVTDQYLPTKDISLSISDKVSAESLSLTIFSNGNWIPVFWSKANRNKFTFTKMASNVLYLPGIDDKTKHKIKFYPLVIKQTHIQSFKPDFLHLTDVEIKSLESKQSLALKQYGLDITEKIFYENLEYILMTTNWAPPLTGERYKLFYWDQEWKFLEEKIKIQNTPLVFESVPSNAIYRIVSTQQEDKRARIFSYENNSQIWW